MAVNVSIFSFVWRGRRIGDYQVKNIMLLIN